MGLLGFEQDIEESTEFLLMRLRGELKASPLKGLLNP